MQRQIGKTISCVLSFKVNNSFVAAKVRRFLVCYKFFRLVFEICSFCCGTNNYDLSINKYKEVVYEKVEYPKPAVLISEIEELQKEITSDLSELKKMLGE